MLSRWTLLALPIALNAGPALAQKTLATSLGDRYRDHFGTAMHGAGDVDRDGYPDWIAASRNDQTVMPRPADYVKVVSGRTGQTIRLVQPAAPKVSFAYSVSGAGDL